ncbi:Uncharacterised protein [Streptococcus pneumoniae]|nr:Uncharacterised protein [Streptococcus pneumoniae]
MQEVYYIYAQTYEIFLIQPSFYIERSSGSEFQSGWQEHQLIAEKVSKTLDKTFDKDVREIPTSQFYQKFVDEMGRTYSGNLILQELITVNGAYKATYIGELSSN